MGGRGATSSQTGGREAFVKDIVNHYGEFTRGDLQGVVEAYAMTNKLDEQKLLKEIDDRAEKKQSESSKIDMTTKQGIISALKQQTKVDLTKALDENRFGKASRKYIDIDSRKLDKNEFNTMMKYLKVDKGLRIETNGAYNYAIYLQPKKK